MFTLEKSCVSSSIIKSKWGENSIVKKHYKLQWKSNKQILMVSSKWLQVKEEYLHSVYFDEKYYVKIVFRIFQCLVALEKISRRKTIFCQHKKYDLF